MVGLSGPGLLPEEEEILRHPHIGGVILFSRNYESPQQIEHLTAHIHRLREPHLLIAVDQEGGRVQRFRDGFTRLPPLRRLGEAYNHDPPNALQLSETLGWLMAVELRAVGVDFSFAPVLDIDRELSIVIGDRAFHGDPKVVAKLAGTYTKGMMNAGMAATAKHFPGHGGAQEDSHDQVVVDERSYGTLQQEDMLPFKSLIQNGLVAVMASHVVYRAVDPQPAGFSAFWLHRVLRGELGFHGVIFSDDVFMAGASVAGDVPERVQAALDAGCDMILLCQPAGERQTLKTLEEISISGDPVTQLRLIRMHGRKKHSRAQLTHDPSWQNAVQLARQFTGQQTLDL